APPTPPWGLLPAPPGSGPFSNDLLVGNFGDGHINAYDPKTGAFRGQLADPQGNPIVIDDLWGLTFGNSATAGGPRTLFFAAGIEDETHGLFGTLTLKREALFATGAGPGASPEVKGFNADGTLKLDFLAYGAGFPGGVRVAVADVNGDGVDDIITGAGPGAGPHVKVFSGTDDSLLQSFFAYDPSFHGGVFVAAGDVNGDGLADVVTRAGPGAGPPLQGLTGTGRS